MSSLHRRITRNAEARLELVVARGRLRPRGRGTAVAAAQVALPPADGLEVLVAALVAFVGGAAWFALFLAWFGAFAGTFGAVLSLVVGVGLAAAVCLRVASVRWPGRVELGTVAALMLGGAALLFRPHEYVLGGFDPGVYVNTAAHIATERSIVWTDSDLALLPDELQDTLFREAPQRFTQGSRLVGFYLTDLRYGESVPHGMHLYPATLAIGFGLAGLSGALHVTPLLALSAIASAALLARRWGGPMAGLVAAALLVANPAELWLGRYPAAEIALQAFTFGGLLLLAVGLDHRSAVLCAVAGLTVGLGQVAKVESFVVPVAVAAVAAWLWAASRFDRASRWFVVGYFAMLAFAALHAWLYATHYASTVYGRYLPSTPLLLGLAVLAILALFALGIYRRQVAELALAAELAWPRVWRGVAIAAVVLVTFAWIVRPLDPFGQVAAAGDLGVVVRNQIESLPRLSWFLPAIAIALGFAGWLVAVRGARFALPLAILAAILPLEAIAVLIDPRITPEYPWAARRWVALLIPALIVFAAVMVARLPAMMPRFGAYATALLGLVAVTQSAVAAWPLVAHREQSGAAALVERIATPIPIDGIVLFDDDLLGWRLSVPLQFLHGRASYVLFGEAGRDDRAKAAFDEWSEGAVPLFWVRAGDPAAFQRFGRTWESIEARDYALPEVASTVDAPPTKVRQYAGRLTIYRAVTPTG